MSPSPPSDHPGSPASGAETRNNDVSAGQDAVSPLLQRLADLIAEAPLNLVARNERGAVFERHIRECIDLAAHLGPIAGRWMDLGTGGGLPGLVLAIEHPSVHWTLVDATGKKAAVVDGFVQELGLANVTVVAGRAETLGAAPAYRAQFDGVVARAVAPLPTLAELARGFLQDGGVLVAMKGPSYAEEVAAAAGAARILRLPILSTDQLRSPARETWVVTMRAEGPPPAGYPRRDGLPKHDPLR